MKNEKLVIASMSKLNWIKNQVFSDELPSKKWYSKNKNRNNEIRKSDEFESIYDWQEIDAKDNARKYREMINEFRVRNGFKGYE